MSIKKKASELSKNQKALAGLVQIVAYAVVATVVLYCDIQFIQVMSRTFPDGFTKIFSVIGAVATGASVLALIGAEAFWFSRGSQMVFGWIFTTIEVIISAANVILSFEMAGGKLDPAMTTWLFFCPATPVVSAICWIIVFNLDQGQKARHDHREMQDDIAESDREHERAVHEQKMVLKTRYLESTVTYLDQIADDPRIQAGLQAGAWKFAAEELRNLTGILMPAQPPQLSPTTVEGSTSPTTQQVKPVEKKPDATPEQEPDKKAGWFKNPFAREPKTTLPTYFPEHAEWAAKQNQAENDAQYAEFLEWKKQQATTQFAQPSPTEHETVTGPISAPLALPGTDGFDEMVKQLSPLVVAPNHNGNGASQNGHK